MLLLLAYNLLGLLGSASLVSAAKPTSFCKCTCFTNSTIIPLDAHLKDPDLRRSLAFPLQFRADDEKQEPVPDPPPSSSPTADGLAGGDNGSGKGEGDRKSEDDGKNYRAGTCNDCTRQFCLDYNLPICKKATLEDVFTTCFQRDSAKDEAVVFIFIIATVSLLVWAAAKPWINKWFNIARERSSYIPVADGDN